MCRNEQNVQNQQKHQLCCLQTEHFFLYNPSTRAQTVKIFFFFSFQKQRGSLKQPTWTKIDTSNIWTFPHSQCWFAVQHLNNPRPAKSSNFEVLQQIFCTHGPAACFHALPLLKHSGLCFQPYHTKYFPQFCFLCSEPLESSNFTQVLNRQGETQGWMAGDLDLVFSPHYTVKLGKIQNSDH